MIRCSCGAKVDQDAFRRRVAVVIDEGETVTEVECEACPQCEPGLDGDGYIMIVLVEGDE